MTAPEPAPAPTSSLGILGGMALAAVLHVIASIVVVVVGQMIDQKEGALMVLFFWAAIGLAQWVYVGPAALVTKMLGWRSVTKGLLVAGGLGTLMSALCYGGILASNLLGTVLSGRS